MSESGGRIYQGSAVAHIAFDRESRAMPPRERYAALARFNNSEPQFSLAATFMEPLDESRWGALALVDFLVDSAPHELLVRGAQFELCEGSTVVARGTVLISSRRVPGSTVRDTARADQPPRQREAA